MTTISNVYEIPLSPLAQTFVIALGGVDYTLTLRWSLAAECWVLDIADAAGAAMLNGCPLLPGYDILGQYAYLGIKGSLVASTDPDDSLPPTYEGLGSSGKLYFLAAA